jgi:hypothetical protein
MAGGIDAKGAMLEANDACDAAEEEAAEGAEGTGMEPAEAGGKAEADDDGDVIDVFVLEADHPVAVEIDDVIERRGRIEFEEEPADVGMEEALADVVGIFLVIDELVVAAMLGAPEEGRVLKGGGAEEEGEEADGPVGPERKVGEEPVIAEGDAEAGGDEHSEEKGELEPIDAKTPEVEGNGGEGQKERSDEEAAGGPIDAVKGDSEFHLWAEYISKGRARFVKIR